MVSHPINKFPARLIELSLLTLALTASAAGQESHYLVFFPSTITGGRYSGDVDIFAALIGNDASLAWDAEHPKPIAAQSYREFAPVVLSDNMGGAFLIYSIEHTDSAFGGDRDVVMRRVDRFGDNLLGDSSSNVVGVAHSEQLEFEPSAVATSDGGVLILYHVRSAGSGGAEAGTDVAAIKVDKAGTHVWPNPVWVSRTRGEDLIADVVSDRRGGAIAIVERRSHAEATETGDILAIHVDSQGRIGWGASHEPIPVGASRHDELNAAACSDGMGGAYIAYEVRYTGGPRLGDHDILAQHITSAGQREWVSEAALPVVSSVPTANETNPTIVLDTNGVIVAFEMDFHSEKRPVRIIGVQHMDATGRITWNRGKKPEVVGVLGRRALRPRLTGDFYGGAFLTLEAEDTLSGDIDVYAQKFTSAGDQLWADGDAPLALFRSPDRERDVTAVADGTGGLIAVASKEFISVDGSVARKIVAQRITADARNPWSSVGGPLLLSNTSTRDSTPVVVRAQ